MIDKWLDAYELKARDVPGLIVVFPVLIDALSRLRFSTAGRFSRLAAAADLRLFMRLATSQLRLATESRRGFG